MPNWPVQLTKPISGAAIDSSDAPPLPRLESVRSNASSGSEAPETLMPSRALKPPSGGNPVWFHGAVNKSDCEAILVAASAAGRPEHGAFFVRELPDKTDSFG